MGTSKLRSAVMAACEIKPPSASSSSHCSLNVSKRRETECGWLSREHGNAEIERVGDGAVGVRTWFVRLYEAMEDSRAGRGNGGRLRPISICVISLREKRRRENCVASSTCNNKAD